MPTDSLFARIVEARDHPDDVFWHYVMMRDPYWKHLGEAQRRKVMHDSVHCGSQSAGYFSDVRLPIRTLCADAGIQISIYEDVPQSNREIFALFEAPSTIRLRPDLIQETQAKLDTAEYRALLGTFQLEDVMLAHELFHFLERIHKKTIYTQTEKTTTISIGPIHVRKRLTMSSEVAAMAFVQSLLGLPWNPYLLDAIIVSRTDPQATDGILTTWQTLREQHRKGT